MKAYNSHFLTPYRIKNLAQLSLDYIHSIYYKKGRIHAFPYAASIEPANYCNLACPQCPTGQHLIKKHAQQLSYQDFCTYVNALGPTLMYLNLYFQGEPFLNDELPQMIRYASDKQIFTCVSTNGHFLSPSMIGRLKTSGIGKLIICLDGANEEAYQKYRVGGNFQKVTESIRLACQAGLPVEVQCLLLSSTENEKEEITALAHSLGARHLVFKKAQFYNDYLMPSHKSSLRYKKLPDGSFQVRKKLKNRCWRMFSSVVIDINGNVLPCCYDKFAQYSYGNLKMESFPQIWHGKLARNFRRLILKNRKSVPMCCNCTE